MAVSEELHFTMSNSDLQLDTTDEFDSTMEEEKKSPKNETTEEVKKSPVKPPHVIQVERCTARFPKEEDAIKDHRYVHKKIKEEFHKYYDEVKKSKACPVCFMALTGQAEALRRHVWSHLVIHLCKCGRIFHSHEAHHGHQNRQSQSQQHTAILIDRPFYPMARKDILTPLPREFSTRDKAPPRRITDVKAPALSLQTGL